MKFNKHLTTRTSSYSGLEQCRGAALDGRLTHHIVRVSSSKCSQQDGIWRRIPVQSFHMKSSSDDACGPLDLEGMLINPREPILEELTRHTQTSQAFIPCDGPIIVAAVSSRTDDPDSPDPRGVSFVPCNPGEVVIVEKGIWHTLPFAFAFAVNILTAVHRLPPGIYHDVRDLPAENWFAEIGF